MPMPTLAALRGEYEELFASARILPERSASVALVAHKVMRGRARYEAVAAMTGVPWVVIGIIHAREADCDFRCHLHNGDPLTARTHHVPAGRPLHGEPPFTWEDSAADALVYDKLPALGPDWDAAAACYAAEKINGFGYRQKIGIRSPYLWGGTNHQQRGKYVADGRYDYTRMDVQPGAAAVLLSILAVVPDALGARAPTVDVALDVSAIEPSPPAQPNAPKPQPAAVPVQQTAPVTQPALASVREVAASKSGQSLLGVIVATLLSYLQRITDWFDTLFAGLPDVVTDVTTQLDSMKALTGLLGAGAKAAVSAESLTAITTGLALYALYRRFKPRGA